MAKKIPIDDFMEGYLTAALWTETDEDGLPLDRRYGISDIADEAIESAKEDCVKFQAIASVDLTKSKLSKELQGHNFWLTRNGHGTGFWDRDLGAVGDRLSKASEKFGESNLYVGDDGKLYFMQG